MENLGRLNVLLELFTELAQEKDLDAFVRTLGSRLRWVLEFQQFTLALTRQTRPAYWTATRDRECLEPTELDALPDDHQHMIAAVLRDRTPASTGQPMTALSYALDVQGELLGAICFSAQTRYSYRDLRIVHHIAQFLAGTIARMQQAATIQRLAIDLDAANQAKDDFLAMLGHELRNPLAPIVTAAELLAHRAGSEPSNEVVVIQRQAEHVVRLIDDLLDVTRLTRGDVQLRLAPVEIATVIASSVEMATSLLEQRQHVLEIEVPATGLLISGDVSRLSQVVANLLTNAARYTNPGGRLRVTGTRDEQSVVIAVTDNGLGIAPELVPHIFTRFTRGLAKHATAGLGLGLAIVKALTELHHGSVSVHSDGPNRGSTFSIRLPLLDVAPMATPSVSAPTALKKTWAPRRVVLVDDNQDAAYLLSRLLESVGHDVAVFHDGPAALNQIEQLRPEVALLDIGLPVMSGYELAREMRSLLGAGTPYLVAVTGYGQQRDRDRSHDAGFDAHLVKPVDSKAVLQAIERAPALLLVEQCIASSSVSKPIATS